MRSIDWSRATLGFVFFLAGLSLAPSLKGDGWSVGALWDLENAQTVFSDRGKGSWPPDLSVEFRFDLKRDTLRMIEDVKAFEKRELHQASFDAGRASSDQTLDEPRRRKRPSLSARAVTFGTVLADYRRHYTWREVPAFDPPPGRAVPWMGDSEICAWDRLRFDRADQPKRPVPEGNSCWNEPPASIPEPGTNVLLSISALVACYLVWRRRDSADPEGRVDRNPLL